ncbi:hypothetical protein J437_LFUL008466, partial [Ladona fulva]
MMIKVFKLILSILTSQNLDPHFLLIAKLSAICFSGPVLDWLESYQVKRSQTVKIKSFDPFSILFLVSSKLITFNIYFADELILFCTIKDLNDWLTLKSDLNDLTRCCNANCTTQNSNPIFHYYYKEDYLVECTSITKNLEVNMDPQLNLDYYIN